MTIILLANYQHDAQCSMQRYAALLYQQLRSRSVDVVLIRPEAYFGRIKKGHSGIGKWLGYVDKFLIFPFRLRRVIHVSRKKAIAKGHHLLVHICDHSNSPYLFFLCDTPALITIHDLIAIRAARNNFEPIKVSRSGQVYQTVIATGLRMARHALCVSKATQIDFERFIGRPPGIFTVIWNSLNFPYSPLAESESSDLLRTLGLPTNKSYFLHVGSEAWYKNRGAILGMFAAAKPCLPPTTELWFVGPPFEAETLRTHGIEGSVRTVPAATSPQLQALYSKAMCLLFPSLEEGFGWPVIEAFACGCPVITSNKPPLNEIGEDAALYIDPHSAGEGAKALCNVAFWTLGERQKWIEKGLMRVRAFSVEEMMSQLLHCYQTLSSGRASA